MLFPGAAQEGVVSVHVIHDLDHRAQVGRAKGRHETDLLQWQFGGVEHQADDTHVTHALLHRFQFAANLGQRATISLIPGDFHLAGFGQFGVHGGNETLADQPNE